MIADILQMIVDERKRQIEVEGWDEAHDMQHEHGELLRVANFYYMNARGAIALRSDGLPVGWPWDPKWWKPKTSERDLVRAGALALAEYDQLTRDGLYSGHAWKKFEQIMKELERLKS
jgi:hypothetical protein